jgi:hypothetical protein
MMHESTELETLADPVSDRIVVDLLAAFEAHRRPAEAEPA